MKITALLDELQNNGTLATGEHEAITAHLRAPSDRLPWYLYALVAVGAWIASIFLLSFVGALFSWLISDNEAFLILAGAGLIAGSLFASRAKLGVFVDQACLACSVTGHLMVYGGIAHFANGNEFAVITITSILLAAGLYGIYTDSLHRFLSTGSAFALIWVWMMQDQFTLWGTSPPVHLTTLLLGDVLIGVQLAILAWVFLRPGTATMWLPLGYATAVAVLAEEGLSRFISMVGLNMLFGLHGSHVFYTLALVGVLVWIAGKPYVRPRTLGEIGVLCAALALGFAGTPASLLAVTFLLVGFALQDRFFIVSGAVSLGYFLFIYYYEIKVDLATKSRLLLLVGVLFLLARLFLKLSVFKGKST